MFNQNCPQIHQQFKQLLNLKQEFEQLYNLKKSNECYKIKLSLKEKLNRLEKICFPYRCKVDYLKSNKELIEEGEYNHVYFEIKLIEQRPADYYKEAMVNFKLIPLDYFGSGSFSKEAKFNRQKQFQLLDEVVEKLNEKGLRAATFAELLTFGAQFTQERNNIYSIDERIGLGDSVCCPQIKNIVRERHLKVGCIFDDDSHDDKILAVYKNK